jgi:hypothetical protein
MILDLTFILSLGCNPQQTKTAFDMSFREVPEPDLRLCDKTTRVNGLQNLCAQLTRPFDGNLVDEPQLVFLTDPSAFLHTTGEAVQLGNDAVPEASEVPISVPGDLWILGNHRVYCGDATQMESIEKVMAGGPADMVFCDPPYRSPTVRRHQPIGSGSAARSQTTIWAT